MGNSSEEVRQVLNMLESGHISAAEAASLLAALRSSAQAESEQAPEALLAELSSPPVGEQDEENTMIGLTIDPEEPATRASAAPVSRERPAASPFPAPESQAAAQFEIPAGETSGADAPYESESPASDTAETGTPPPPPAEIARWRRYWLVPFLIGFGIMLLGTAWMYWAVTNSGYGLAFACAWVPFLIGVGVLAVGWNSRTYRWLHVRVKQHEDEWPRNIAISLPLPLDMIAWLLRTFHGRIPGLERSGLSPEKLSEMVRNLGKYATPEAPFYVQVEEDDQVLIYIG